MKKKNILFLLLLSVFILSLAGCSKVNNENYQKLQVGMTYREVSAILGKPFKKAESLNYIMYVWRDKDKKVKIKFTDERVISFSKKGF